MLVCLDCSLPYDEFGMDTTVPNLQWEMIMGHEGGILCASCMVKRASKIRGVLAARMVFEIVPGDPVGDRFIGLESILRNRTGYNETS